MMCCWNRMVMLSLLVLLIYRPLILQAEDYSAIRKANEDSIVYIHSQRIPKDGQGAFKHSYGTGFIIEETGHVMTASHVILEEDKDHIVQTTGSIRSKYLPPLKLELVKRDSVDVAILMFPDVGQKWKPVQFGNSKNVPRDAPLYTLGFPENSDQVPAVGILSSKFGYHGMWQTTLPIQRGDSGAPIFDLTGKVVAIATGGIDVDNNITYAIPEWYITGIRLAANLSLPVGLNVAQIEPTTDVISQNFTFYRGVDHEEEDTPSQDFCLPDGYKVTSSTETITTINGSGTHIVSAAPSQNASNCITLKAFIKGSGVVRLGPIIVDHKGRGWLGANIKVEGKRDIK